MKNFSIIVAIEENGGIGYENKLPWDKIKEDIEWFRNSTSGNIVIMGRNTWNSIPTKFRPLKDRLNIIISQTMKNEEIEKYDNTIIKLSLEDALQYCEILNDSRKVFIIGGQRLYEEAIIHKKCDEVYVSYIKEQCNCDTYFPEKYLKNFTKIVECGETTYCIFRIYKK